MQEPSERDDALAVVKDLDARMVSLKELRGHLVCGTEWQATGMMRTRKKATGCPSCGRIKQAQARQKTILKKGVKPLSQTHEML